MLEKSPRLDLRVPLSPTPLVLLLSETSSDGLGRLSFLLLLGLWLMSGKNESPVLSNFYDLYNFYCFSLN